MAHNLRRAWGLFFKRLHARGDADAEYEREIYNEYTWMPINKFRVGRAVVLQRFLDRDSIYSTKYFHDKYEDKAQQNLQSALKNVTK